MTSPRIRLCLFLLLVCLLPGCGPSKADNVSNPDLQVPDVPPSNRTTQSPVQASK